MALPKNPFDSGVTDLDTVGVAPTEFDAALSDQIRQDTANSLTPESVDVSDANTVDIESQGNISVNRDPLQLQTFDLLAKKDPDAKSDTDILGFNVDSAADIAIPDFAGIKDIGRGTGPSNKISNIGTSGETEEEAVTDPVDGPQTPQFDADISAVTDYIQDKALNYGQQGIDYLKDLYQDQFGTQSLQTTGSLRNLSQYGQPYSGGYLGTYPTQSSIGLSSAPPASLAGSSSGAMAQMASGTYSGFANLGVKAGTQTGLGTFASMGSSGTTGLSTGIGNTAASSSRSIFGTAASVYGIYDGIKNKEYFSAGTSLMALINPATAIPMAIMQATKMLFGAWSASKRAKPKFGGAEFAATKNSLTATSGYGYNGYNPSAGQATVASVADYVNTYTKTFGLNFNGNKWAKAIEADPRLNRYDTMDDSGYADPSVLSRKIFETKGLITGNPTYNGQAITSQEDYKKKMEEFNEYYKKTALERGGLVDAKRVGITQDLSNEYKQITFKNATQVGGGGSGPNYTTRNVGGSRGGGGTTQTGYWRPTGGGGRGGGGSTWVPAAPNVVVNQGYYGNTAHAVSYSYEDATPHEMLYRNLVGSFQRGQGGTYY